MTGGVSHPRRSLLSVLVKWRPHCRPHRHNQIAHLQTKPVTPDHNGLIIRIGLKFAEPCDLNAGALRQRLEVPLQRQAADRAAAHQKYVGSSSRLEVFVQFYVIASR